MRRFVLLLLIVLLAGFPRAARGRTILWIEGWESVESRSRWRIEGGAWEFGHPTGGPGAAHDGEWCAATGLAGGYPEPGDYRLVLSNSFVVPPAQSNPRIRFWHWFDLGAGDSAWVEIRRGMGPWEKIDGPYTSSGCGVWSSPLIDLRAYENASVTLAFHLAATIAGAGDAGSGWYLDDVALETGPFAFDNPQKWEAGPGDWRVSNGVWEVGVPLSGPGAAHGGQSCAATVLEGDYCEPRDSRLISPPFTVPAAVSRPSLGMWHWYDFAPGDTGWVEVRPAGGVWSTISRPYVGSSIDPAHPDGWINACRTCSDTLSLVPFEGQRAELAFHVKTTGNGGSTGAGWYIDQVSVNGLVNTSYLEITSLAPPPGQTQPNDAALAATFASPLDSASVRAETWLVTGSLSGNHPARSIDVQGNTARFYPLDAFRAGERVTSVLKGGAGGIRSTNVPPDTLAADLSWSFDVAAPEPCLFRYPAGFPDRRYFLLSLPTDFDAGIRLSTALSGMGPAGPASWRGFGLVGGVYREDPLLRPGAGYWLATARAFPIQELHGLCDSRPDSFDLEPGWNLIGALVDSCRSWSDAVVRAGSQSTQFGGPASEPFLAPEVWWYEDDTGDLANNGTFRIASGASGWSTCDNRWGGYLVYAFQPSTLIFPHLSGAFITKRTVNSPADAAPITGPSIAFSLRCGRLSDGAVKVGLRDGGRPGYDIQDVFKPPFAAAGFRLAITQPDGPWPEFMEAYESPVGDSHEWDLSVDSAEGGALSWTCARLDPDWNAYLTDPATGMIVDLRRRSRLPLSGATRSTYRVSITRGIDETSLPPRTAFLDVSSVPGSGVIDLEFAVAQPGAVAITMYDVTGRLVLTPLDSTRSRGRFNLSVDAGAARLASGIYFLKLSTTSAVDSRRLVYQH